MMCFSSVFFYVFLYPWMNEMCPVKILFLCQLLSGHHSSCLGLRAVGRLVPRFHLVVVEPLTIIIAVLVISHTGALAPVYSLNHHSLAAGFHHFQALSLFEPFVTTRERLNACHPGHMKARKEKITRQASLPSHKLP